MPNRVSCQRTVDFFAAFHGDSTHASQSPIQAAAACLPRTRFYRHGRSVPVRRGICSAAIPDRYLNATAPCAARRQLTVICVPAGVWFTAAHQFETPAVAALHCPERAKTIVDLKRKGMFFSAERSRFTPTTRSIIGTSTI